MGDRITKYLPCPKCGKESEQFDAPSCLQWAWNCEHCGWKDDRDYYEEPDNIIKLCTVKEARAEGLIKDCPKCKKYMTWWEEKKFKMCLDCKEKLKKKII